MASRAATRGLSVRQRNQEALQSYVADIELQDLTPRTVENYESNVKIFIAHLGKLPVERVGVEELKRFLAHLRGSRDLGAKGISRYFSGLASFYDYLEFTGRVASNPVPGFRKRYLKQVTRDAKKDAAASASCSPWSR